MLLLLAGLAVAAGRDALHHEVVAAAAPRRLAGTCALRCDAGLCR